MDSLPQGWLQLTAGLSRERAPCLSALPSLGLALPRIALFVSMATKQCPAHTLPHKPQATPSSERNPTRSSVGRWCSSACPVSPPLPGLGAKASPPLPHYRNIPDTSAWTALGMTWTSRTLGAHLALPLGFSCLYSGPWLAWAVLMIPSGSQS